MMILQSPRTFPNYLWESYKMRLRATVWADVVFIWERRELLSWETILGSFFFLAILGSVLWIASSGQKRGLLLLHCPFGCDTFWKRSSVRWKRRWVTSFLGRWEVLGYHWPNMKFLWESSKLVTSWGVRCCTDCRQMGFKRTFHLSCLSSANRNVALFSLWRFWNGLCRCVCSM